MGNQLPLLTPRTTSPAVDRVRALRLARHVAASRCRATFGSGCDPELNARLCAEDDAASLAYRDAVRALSPADAIAWANEPAICDGGRCEHVRAAQRELFGGAA